MTSSSLVGERSAPDHARQSSARTNAAAVRTRMRQSPTASAFWRHASTTALVALFVLFAYAHLHDWQRTGEPSGLGLVVQEGLAALLFLVRRPSRGTSQAPFDWLMALGGSWLVLACRPSGHAVLGLNGLYTALQLGGVVLVVLSLGTLGRSFGIVAADR